MFSHLSVFGPARLAADAKLALAAMDLDLATEMDLRADRWLLSIGDKAMAVVSHRGYQLRTMRWGASWIEPVDALAGSRGAIVAPVVASGMHEDLRVELPHKPCLIPVSGFYERGARPSSKVFVHHPTVETMMLAAIYSEDPDWHDEDGQACFALLLDSSAPTPKCGPIVMQPPQWKSWLDGSLRESRELLKQRGPAPLVRFALG